MNITKFFPDHMPMTTIGELCRSIEDELQVPSPDASKILLLSQAVFEMSQAFNLMGDGAAPYGSGAEAIDREPV